MALQGGLISYVKSGQVVTDSNGRFNVVFKTPFSDKDFSIQVSPRQIGIATWTNKSATGFRVRTHDVSGVPAPDVTVGWTATRFVDE